MGKISALKSFLKAAYSYRRRKSEVDYSPLRLWVEVTSHCNLQCVVCPNSEREEFGDMEFSLYKKIVDEASLFVQELKLFLGGEPLLHEEIFKMINYASQRGLVTEIHTNGTLLSEEKSKKTLDSGLDVLSISFDGVDKETYESIRVKANFEKVVENIKQFLKLKGRKSRSPYTIIQCLIHPQLSYPGISSNELEKKFKKKFENLPVNEFKFIIAHNFGGKLIDKKTLLPKYSYSKFSYHPCGDIYHALSIKWDGKVVPCCTDFFDQYVLGDARKEELLDIWNNKRMRFLRESIALGREEKIELCADCEKLYQKELLGLPRNLLSLLRVIIGRNRTIGQIESLVRKKIILKQ